MYRRSMDDIEPNFIENDDPKDGELSVTSEGKLTKPIHGDKPTPSRGSSLATGGLGSHVMDNNNNNNKDDE